ncbi:MAG: DUF4968 domain-containing protein [Anaerolineae bacterium]|nr:DUF4968 domain-containing protein [Anaerolineae bacterium]
MTDERRTGASWGWVTQLLSIGLRPAWQSWMYQRTRQHQDARFGRPAAPVGPWQRLGALEAYERDTHGVTFRTGQGCLRLDVLAEDCLRVRVSPDGRLPELFSYALVEDGPQTGDFNVTEESDALAIRMGRNICRVARADLRLTVTDTDGRLIYADAEGPVWSGERVRLSARLMPDETGHGLGERAFGFNLRGRSYALWNTDPAGYQRGNDPINLCIPFYVGLRGRSAYGLFWDNPVRGMVAVGAPGAEDRLIFEAEAGGLCYTLFTGPSALDVLSAYTRLTGRMPLPPLWALGYHQSRWSYMSADEVRDIAREFRQRRIPCDAIYLDIDYMDGFRCFTWHPRRFPNPAGLISDLKAAGFRTVVMIDPGIKVDRSYRVCRDGLAQGAFLRYPDGRLFVAPVWPGNCYFPDFTAPAVRQWWGTLYRDLLEAGVAGVWNDMNEPAIFSSDARLKEAPDYLVHDYEGRSADHRTAHNVYGMQMVRATREGLERLQPERRHLVITRSGYAGVQRYASSWTADNHSTWDHLKLSISMCLNLGMSGLAFTGPDIGGFAGEADGELFTRWVQAGILLPFFRGHTAKWTGRHEPWAFGQPYEDICRKYIALRYCLLPCLYTAFAECARYGWPIVRPLALLDPDLVDCDDAYLLGETLLVAPVVEPGAQTRTVCLPSGVWYDYWSGTKFKGGKRYQVEAPLDQLPLFARAGSVIPHWPEMLYTGEKVVDELTLRVYAGDGRSPLYEDAGEGKDYQAGVFRWSHFACATSAKQFDLHWEREGPYVPGYRQIRLQLYGLAHPPQQISLDGSPVAWQMQDGCITFSTDREFEALSAVF